MFEKQPKGFTLVELMIVVAIIGVISAIGIVAFQRSANTAKIQRLVHLASEVKAKQDIHVDKHGSYWPIEDNIGYQKIEQSSPPGVKKPFEKILGMKAPESSEIQIKIWSAASGAAGSCPAPCPVTPATTPWVVVMVEHDLDGAGSTSTNTAAFIATGMAEPQIINEGQ